MKVDITLIMEYSGAPDLGTEHTITAEINPWMSVTQTSLDVEKEIYDKVDTLIRRC